MELQVVQSFPYCAPLHVSMCVHSHIKTVYHFTCAPINQTCVLNERLVICARTHMGAL